MEEKPCGGVGGAWRMTRPPGIDSPHKRGDLASARRVPTVSIWIVVGSTFFRDSLSVNFTVGPPPFSPSLPRLFFPQFFYLIFLLSQPPIPTPTSPEEDFCRISTGNICGELPLWFHDIYVTSPSSRLHVFLVWMFPCRLHHMSRSHHS